MMGHGDRITDYQISLAKRITGTLNSGRDDLRQEYPLDPSTAVVETINKKLRAKGVQDDEVVKEGMESLKKALAEDIEHRKKVARWLVTILPKMDSTEVHYRKVIRSLLNQEELFYTEEDWQIADEVMNPPHHTHHEPQQKKTDVDELEDYELAIIAEGLLKILIQHANRGESVKQADIYSRRAFKEVVSIVSPSVSARQAFFAAWHMLTAFFEDEDPSYQLFRAQGRGFGASYILSDPELAEGMWGAA